MSFSWRIVPALAAAVVLSLAAGATTTAPAVQAQAACTYPINTLEQEAQKAPVIVLADAIRERFDGQIAYTTTLKVQSAFRGVTSTPIISIPDLGHVDLDCQGGPRLVRGGRYVLFLNETGTSPNVVWSLVDAEAGVYQLFNSGVRFPPQRAGDAPQAIGIAPAEFVRDVAVNLLGDDSARIEDLIQRLALPETVSTPQAAPPEKPWYERLPRQETAFAVAGAAVMLASLIYLLWRPRGPNPYRRP